jgi:surface protein
MVYTQTLLQFKAVPKDVSKVAPKKRKLKKPHTMYMIEEKRKMLERMTIREVHRVLVEQGKSNVIPELLDSITKHMVRSHVTATEERYQFVVWLYRIRTEYRRMGLFQPDFIWKIFNPMMPSKYQKSNFDIQKTVDDWCEDPVAATAKYGHISKWNTSRVTTMKSLFKNKKEFNDDISKWDVSNVTNMDSVRIILYR